MFHSRETGYSIPTVHLLARLLHFIVCFRQFILFVMEGITYLLSGWYFVFPGRPTSLLDLRFLFPNDTVGTLFICLPYLYSFMLVYACVFFICTRIIVALVPSYVYMNCCDPKRLIHVYELCSHTYLYYSVWLCIIWCMCICIIQMEGDHFFLYIEGNSTTLSFWRSEKILIIGLV
jgi:hypothetical protein